MTQAVVVDSWHTGHGTVMVAVVHEVKVEGPYCGIDQVYGGGVSGDTGVDLGSLEDAMADEEGT